MEEHVKEYINKLREDFQLAAVTREYYRGRTEEEYVQGIVNTLYFYGKNGINNILKLFHII